MTVSLRTILLLPFTLLYGIVIHIRNMLYNRGILCSERFDIPIISIGNLAVGGTGKTPHASFFLEKMDSTMPIAYLSRGYKRKTRGFVLAHPHDTFTTIGDEPTQILRNHPSAVVAVDGNRVRGIRRLLSLYPELRLILLDDAFQHRKVRAGLSILLTEYTRLYTRDGLMPGGNLREPKEESKRANILIVTKCSPTLTPIEMDRVVNELKPLQHQQVFFSSFAYGNLQPLYPQNGLGERSLQWLKETDAAVLLVSGIANPTPLIAHLQSFCSQLVTFTFPDHHTFTPADLQKIHKKFMQIENPAKWIITTEKDAVRLINNNLGHEFLKNLIFVLPVKIHILGNKENTLLQKINDYVTENSRNC